MSKLLALFIFSSIFFFNFYWGDSINVTAALTPTPQQSAESDIIELDRNTVGGSCQPGYRCSGNCDDIPVVITVSGTKSERDTLRYNYTISGGRIVGEGTKVSWDLKGAQPGTYQIKINVIDKKSGNSLQSATKTVTVEFCHDDGDRCLECPALSIDAPTTPTEAGEPMIFAANVNGGNAENMVYNWTISDGKIIEGQGTPVIRVATNPKMAGKTVRTTVNFKWDCSEICKDNTASVSSLVARKKRRNK